METRVIDNRLSSITQHQAAIEPAIPHARQTGGILTHQPMDPENPSAGLPRRSQIPAGLPGSVEEANAVVKTAKSGVSFALDRESEKVVVRVINQETGEVIRQIPSEEFLNMMGRMQEMVGLFMDRVA